MPQAKKRRQARQFKKPADDLTEILLEHIRIMEIVEHQSYRNWSRQLMEMAEHQSYRNWLKQPIDIWNIICYSVPPVAQMKIRSNLRATCKYFNQKLGRPVSKSYWNSYYSAGNADIILLKHGASIAYLYTHRLASSINICQRAARADRLDILQKMRDDINISTLVAAVVAGSVRCLRFAQNYVPVKSVRSGYCQDTLLETSAFHGHVECLQYLHENGLKLTKTARNNAVSQNHIDCLRYLCANGMKMSSKNAITAARRGNLETLVFIHQSGVDIDDDIMKESIKGGLECFRYTHKALGRFPKDICEVAASNKNLACLTYAHLNGAMWSYRTCHAAATNGSLECLRYAYSNGCPLDKTTTDPHHYNTCQRAAAGGNYECLVYCHQNGIKLNHFVLSSAKSRGDRACIEYVKKHLRVYSS